MCLLVSDKGNCMTKSIRVGVDKYQCSKCEAIK